MHYSRWHKRGSFASRRPYRREAVSGSVESVHKSNAEPVSLVKVGSSPPQNDADRLSPSEGAELTFSTEKFPDGRHSDLSEAQILPLPLSESQLLERFGPLIREATAAFAVDSSYTTDVLLAGRAMREARA